MDCRTEWMCTRLLCVLMRSTENSSNFIIILCLCAQYLGVQLLLWPLQWLTHKGNKKGWKLDGYSDKHRRNGGENCEQFYECGYLKKKKFPLAQQLVGEKNRWRKTFRKRSQTQGRDLQSGQNKHAEMHLAFKHLWLQKHRVRPGKLDNLKSKLYCCKHTTCQLASRVTRIPARSRFFEQQMGKINKTHKLIRSHSGTGMCGLLMRLY